jgi:hypothetical protein
MCGLSCILYSREVWEIRTPGRLRYQAFSVKRLLVLACRFMKAKIIRSSGFTTLPIADLFAEILT